jgi:hypothetical protein
MGGPIVRTGTTPEFWRNYDQVFGKKDDAKTEKSGKKTAKKASAKKTTAKKATKKKAKKKK